MGPRLGDRTIGLRSVRDRAGALTITIPMREPQIPQPIPMPTRVPPDLNLSTLEAADREAAIPVIKDGFVGIYRWHAKRTLARVPVVRAAWLGTELVGVAMLERLVPEAGYVYYISVAASHRRRGIGAVLLDDALSRFRAEGVHVVYAAVESENSASLALFRSRGFRVVERKEPSYKEGGLGAWGLRSRMWVVSGEVLLGLRIAPGPMAPKSSGA